MKNITGRIVTADESVTGLGAMSLEAALAAFDSFPWETEVAKVQRTGVFPTLSFYAPDKGGSYINVIPNEDHSFFTMIDVVKGRGILAALFRGSAFIDFDSVTADEAREQVKRFFELDCDALIDWVRQEKRQRPERSPRSADLLGSMFAFRDAMPARFAFRLSAAFCCFLLPLPL